MIVLIRDRMTALNDTIAQDRSLGAQFRVGHSMSHRQKRTSRSPCWFRWVIETEIGPLLEEYWFDVPDRAREAVQALRMGL